jgi:hypothetical protein
MVDYRVASIYFPNGSAVDIAKIPGGPNYQETMRAAYLAEGQRAFPSAAVAGHQLEWLDGLQSLLNVRSVRDHLPPWLGGKRPESQPLLPMLTALKAAAECHLEATIEDVGIVASFPVTEQYLETIRAACSSMHISMSTTAAYPLLAGSLAAPIYGVGRLCDDPYRSGIPNQMILAVDFSRAAVTAALFHEFCGIFEYRRVLHDTDFGLDQLRRDSELGSGLLQEKLEVSLRELVKLPLNDGGNGETVKYLSNLIMLGESAADPQLHNILKKVIGEPYDQLMLTADNGSHAIVNPLFAGSRGAAYDSWFHLDWVERGRPEQIGCLIV